MSLLLGNQHLSAAHVGPQDLGDLHSAVGLEVVLQEGDQHTGRSDLQADGSVKIPAVLQPYMGGKTVLVPSK